MQDSTDYNLAIQPGKEPEHRSVQRRRYTPRHKLDFELTELHELSTAREPLEWKNDIDDEIDSKCHEKQIPLKIINSHKRDCSLEQADENPYGIQNLEAQNPKR